VQSPAAARVSFPAAIDAAQQLLEILVNMPSATPAKDRRHDLRPGLKVKHRHRVGSAIVERVSELVHVRGHPVALLDWIDLGGIRTPLYMCKLDPVKLRAATPDGLFEYDGITADPRFADAIGAD
jgi:hypothetical protein